MEHIYQSVDQLVGNTPLIELSNIEKELGLKARLLAKLEFFNPAGSAKDRVALNMIEDAAAKGLLKEGSVIIEPTSGNTGIGLACIAATRGIRLIIVMPDSMSEERILSMKAYGAELVLTDGKLGMSAAIAKAEELQKEIPGSFIAGQFTNPANPQAHYKTTGPEIWRDTDGNVDCFVAGVGTGGTLSGTGKYLKEQKPEVRIVGVEPAASRVLEGKPAGKHNLQGIGANFIPDNFDPLVCDETMGITDEEAYEAGRMLGRKEGLLCGITSGAALAAAIKLAKTPECKGKTIVALLPDTGNRYLSTELFKE